ncbi:MAG: hypothetical protein JXB23_09495, partial [Candidatus Aminicenantes bacterium]|nr:hypothetical protein [Candidatus Aminicenantes bacterium]
WQASDIRLDTGDTLGSAHSCYPRIACSGSSVYVVWQDDRNSSDDWDIYFNSSINGGASWQSSALRIDHVSVTGQDSISPQLACSGSDVCVVWEDYRNSPNTDIYSNYSTDSGTSWQSSDIRVDTGDSPGAQTSLEPRIARSGNDVYVIWLDMRSGQQDTYFNHSNNNGANWQAAGTRLNTDTPLGNYSNNPRISCRGKKVYAVWDDWRNGGMSDNGDIYFNFSLDEGKTWQSPDYRLDTGDLPGDDRSLRPRVCCSDDTVYVVWEDWRDGARDIYFNKTMLPRPVIKANGSGSNITIKKSDNLTLTIELDVGTHTGVNVDVWLLADTPFGWYFFHMTNGWLPGKMVTYQGKIKNILNKKVFDESGLPRGSYTFYFGLDFVMNGSVNLAKGHYDKVSVLVN